MLSKANGRDNWIDVGIPITHPYVINLDKGMKMEIYNMYHQIMSFLASYYFVHRRPLSLSLFHIVCIVFSHITLYIYSSFHRV